MTPRPPIFALLFMSIFGFIGVAVIIFLWTADGFGAPPLIVKLVGSFIALGFIAMGFGLPLHALTSKHKSPPGSQARPGGPGTDGGSYVCPSYGANVGDAEVSPSGDIRCTYCNSWWNIHRG